MGGETAEPAIIRYATKVDGADIKVATKMGEVDVDFSHFSPAGCTTGDKATSVTAAINYETHSEECECECEPGVDIEVILEGPIEDQNRQRQIALVVTTALMQISEIHTSIQSGSTS